MSKVKTESFDVDPGWQGINNRIAREREPIEVRQDFGFSAETRNAGGLGKGELGGFITAAGEAAYYAKQIEPLTFDQPISASGSMSISRGGTHMLLGFFNSDTVNEWRTPSSIAIRINGRGDKFFAYVEYCTSKWRAGGDTTPFPAITDEKTGRWDLIGFPCDKPLPWSLLYDPEGNGGAGVVRATIGEHTAICNIEPVHRQDGATFNRFGVINVMKSLDSGSNVWFDDIVVNGSEIERFAKDPDWEGRQNRTKYGSRLVRPWFDFGFSETSFAGGTRKGELGGTIFRGDCREEERMACYGDQVGPLDLKRPLKASGKISLRRGVSDSTTLFGFYHVSDSMRQNPSQKSGLPESVLGIHIEGPSSEGFLFYPVLRKKGSDGEVGPFRSFPRILPDSKSHDWSLLYEPARENRRAKITVTLDRESKSFDLENDVIDDGTKFDRFGIVTSWVDGNSQDVYWDDLTYSVKQD